MAQRDTRPAKLDVVAHKALDELQSALRKQGLPRDVQRGDILSALVLYTTPPQVAGMLAEYWRYTERLDADADERPPAEDSAASSG